jgi:hypothetical protein
MKTANIAGEVNCVVTFNLFSSLLLCIVFSHPLRCEAQQAAVRQKPVMSPRQFAIPPAAQQTPNKTAGQVAPQQGAAQTITQAPATPVAGDITRPSVASVSTQKQLPLAKTNNIIFTDHMGGMVFSSGTEDIRVMILPHADGPHPPNEKLWTDARTCVPCGIYLVSPGPERFIGNNIPGSVIVNLGKLPEGEIIFAIKTIDGYTFLNGGADRNLDKTVHAFTRTFALGAVQVWFEDSAANGDRRDNDMDDVAIQLTGGVRGSGKWAELQRALDHQSAQHASGKQAAEKGGARNAPETANPQ